MNTILGHLHTLAVAHNHVFPLFLTMSAYSAAMAIQRIGGHSPLLNPTLLAIAAVIAVLRSLRIDYSSYFSAAQSLHFLLGPAVVALAIPMYRHSRLIRERAADLLIGLTVGSFTAVVTGLGVAWWLGVSRPGLLSIAPKSATTAVSMAVSAQTGGIPPVTAVLTILAGIIGAVTSGYLLNALRIRDPAVRGFSMGLASHGIATARAFQESETVGTFAGLAMGLNAVSTAILVPILVRVILR